MRRQHGLTLVELLVALGVFAFVSVASVGVLTLAVGGQDQLKDATGEIARLERARALIRADLLQAVDRPVREGGAGRERTAPAFYGGDGALDEAGLADEDVLFVLTRTGWDNPGAARPRSELQRVSYVMRDDALIRRARPFLDAAPNTPNTEQTLLEDLRDVSVEFLVQDSWQPAFTSEQGEGPAAIRIEMTHPLYGELRNDFLAGAP